MRPGVALALGLVATIAGCTEATPLDPGRATKLDGGGANEAIDAAGATGGPTAPMVFVPYSPPTTGAAGGFGASGGAAGRGAASGGGPGGPGGMGGGVMAPGGMVGAAGSIAPTMLGLVPTAVSADGTVVAGVDEATRTRAMRWTAMTGALALDEAIGESSVVALDQSGGTLVGWRRDPTTGVVSSISWVETKPYVVGTIQTDDDDSRLVGVSADGKFVAGTSRKTKSPAGIRVQAFRAAAKGPAQGLGFLPGDTGSEAVAISGDGTVVVGFSYDGPRNGRRAFRWTAATGMVEIPPVTAGDSVLPRAVSGNGVRVACDEVSPARTFSFVWDVVIGSSPLVGCMAPSNRVVALSAKTSSALGACTLQVTPLREEPFVVVGDLAMTLPGHGATITSVTPVGISAAAEVVVGLGHGGAPLPVIAIWASRTAPPQLLGSVPVAGGSSAPTVNFDVTALSENGTTITGNLTTTDQAHKGWLLRIR